MLSISVAIVEYSLGSEEDCKITKVRRRNVIESDSESDSECELEPSDVEHDDAFDSDYEKTLKYMVMTQSKGCS